MRNCDPDGKCKNKIEKKENKTTTKTEHKYFARSPEITASSSAM